MEVTTLKNYFTNRVWVVTSLLLATCLFAGCAGDRYHYGLSTFGNRRLQPCEVELAQPITVGGEHPVVDQVEQFVQSPRKLINQLRKLPPPDDTPQQDEALAEAVNYLESNGIEDVYIDVRRYEPREQWQRLKENDRIGPVWKYTFGSLDVIGYSLLPRRALRSDKYSPFTNTLSINSANPAKSLFQAAQCKQYLNQRWLGTYAASQRAPILPLFHLSKVSSDALTYAKTNDRDDLTAELYPLAYAKLGSAAVSDVLYFFPLGADLPVPAAPLVRIASRTTGRLTGKLIADQQNENEENDRETDDASESLNRN